MPVDCCPVERARSHPCTRTSSASICSTRLAGISPQGTSPCPRPCHRSSMHRPSRNMTSAPSRWWPRPHVPPRPWRRRAGLSGRRRGDDRPGLINGRQQPGQRVDRTLILPRLRPRGLQRTLGPPQAKGVDRATRTRARAARSRSP
jgi:hypothetical protein